MSENGEIYTAGKNFTLPPALTALTNSNSASAISLPDRFVAEQQQAVRRKGGSCSLVKMTFYFCKIHFGTHVIIIQG